MIWPSWGATGLVVELGRDTESSEVIISSAEQGTLGEDFDQVILRSASLNSTVFLLESVKSCLWGCALQNCIHGIHPEKLPCKPLKSVQKLFSFGILYRLMGSR